MVKAKKIKAETVRVGAKRRLIIPKRAVDSLSLSQGSQLRVNVVDGTIQLTPVTSGDGDLPSYLRDKFLARQSRIEKGLSLAEFSARARENASRVDAAKEDAKAHTGLAKARAHLKKETQAVLVND